MSLVAVKIAIFAVVAQLIFRRSFGLNCSLDVNGKTYTSFTDTKKDKFSAQRQCTNEGYSLPTFATKTEFDDWIAALKNAGITHRTRVWIGYTYTAMTPDNGNRNTTGFTYDESPNGGSAYNPFADYAGKHNTTESEPWPADRKAGKGAGSCAFAEIWIYGNGQPRMRSAPCNQIKAMTVCECGALQCNFQSQLDNYAAFGPYNILCAAPNCINMACSCTIKNGTTTSINSNQCPDNASFCVTSRGDLTPIFGGAPISCSDGVLTVVDQLQNPFVIDTGSIIYCANNLGNCP